MLFCVWELSFFEQKLFCCRKRFRFCSGIGRILQMVFFNKKIVHRWVMLWKNRRYQQVRFGLPFFYVSEAVHLCKIHIFAVVKDSCFVQKLFDFFKLTTISPSVEKASKIFPERWQHFRFLLFFVVSGFFLHCKVDISAVVDDSRFINCFCVFCDVCQM